MSTVKNVKIQKNKILTYSVNKSGFKTVYGSVLVNENENINVEMINLNSETSQFQFGDRLFGISSFVDYFIPSGSYDVDSLKYISVSQTTGSGLTNIQVVKETWLTKVETELGIETPKGTSNNFIFTYNGSTWDITGALTLAGQSLEDYGISFTGTATSGDVITVMETQYNKFAFFVLDANYRGQGKWANSKPNVMPVRYNSYPSNCLESATYYADYISKNLNIASFPIFNSAKNYGNFILPNGLKINAVIPNGAELQTIWLNKETLDSFDPIIIDNPSSVYSLTNWAQYWSCIEMNNNDSSWYKSNDNTTSGFAYLGFNPTAKTNSYKYLTIFEVPVM